MNISYMGTKRELAPRVAEVVASLPGGPILDAFAGMCSVGVELAATRQVWTNDVQRFAFEVGSSLFTCKDEPLNALVLADLLFDEFQRHTSSIAKRLPKSSRAEARMLASDEFSKFLEARKSLTKALAQETDALKGSPFSLFSRLYPDTYFGVSQATEIDAIVSAIRRCERIGTLTFERARWCRVALGNAMLRLSNSPGHFAQFLSPKAETFKRFIRLRQRSVWSSFLEAVDELSPIRSVEWRKDNKAFNKDSIELISDLASASARPAVVYADPPYTDDQYSRFYHLLETLVLYDYPKVSGAGLYRQHRFRTPFSLKSAAPKAMETLVEGVARCGAAFVLSYPTNGLIYRAEVDPLQILRRSYPKVDVALTFDHTHSTFGASKGPATSQVVEQIFIGRW